MAEQTIRGTKKYLLKEKNFNYEAFYNDLTNLLLKEQIIKYRNLKKTTLTLFKRFRVIATLQMSRLLHNIKLDNLSFSSHS